MPSPRRRALDTDEIDRYEHLPADMLARVRLVRAPVLPPSVHGMTFGRWVLLRGDRIDRRVSMLIAHELVHVRQFAELGPIRFVASYVGQYLWNLIRLRGHRAAYSEISFEIEARREAERWAEIHLPPAE